MFETKSLVFWYAVSPVHMGAGTAVGGLIDNPIQRETHTEHPVFAGSGLKGALREVAEAPIRDLLERYKRDKESLSKEERAQVEELQVIFGPDSGNASDHAGALAVSDAQIVAFPVRALKEAFVHVTSPACLARLKRLAQVAGIAADWEVPAAPDAGKAKLLNPALMSGDQLILEAFAYAADMEKESEPLGQVAKWLAGNALPTADAHQAFAQPFAQRLQQNLVLLRDEDFNHFVRFGTVVEPHVRIDNETGTADDGGLFYTENLPPETVMASLLMATRGRKPKVQMPAEAVMEKAAALLNGQLMQVGGDATTGRGLVITRVLAAEAAGATAEAAE